MVGCSSQPIVQYRTIEKVRLVNCESPVAPVDTFDFACLRCLEDVYHTPRLDTVRATYVRRIRAGQVWVKTVESGTWCCDGWRIK